MSLSEFSDQIWSFFQRSRLYWDDWLGVIVVLWIINVMNWWTGSRLNVLGIVPRHLLGLPGIIFSPFLHQNFNHLFFNSIPLFVLGLILLSYSPMILIQATVSIVLMGGTMVWLLARRACHIGASGLIFGYLGFVIVFAFIYPNATTVVIAVLILYYFGGMLLGVFPKEERVSWESHLYGFISGIASAFLISRGVV